MSIATVITGGFGSFGSVNLVITDGYSAGDAPPEPTPDPVIGRRRRTRRYRRTFPDPAITAPESVDAYPLPEPAAYEPYVAPIEALEAALDALEQRVRLAEIQRDVAAYREARRRQREMERIAARKRREREDEDAAAYLLLN